MIIRSTLAAVAVLLGAGALTACSGADTGGPQSAATAFEQAVSGGDGGAACRVLSPEVAAALAGSAGSPCAQAVLEQDLPASSPVRDARVYGKQAWVVTGTDTVFLSRFPAGWKVIGAGCRPQGDRPYDCAVSGS